MKTPARWDPFREFAPFTTFPEVEKYLAEFPLRSLTTGYEPVPTMRVDVTESDAAYKVVADVPGMKKEDIAVSIDGNTVSISAEATREKEAKEGETLLRTERYSGAVSRVLTFPLVVDPATAEASYDGGVLTLTLPKAPGTRTRRLAVH